MKRALLALLLAAAVGLPAQAVRTWGNGRILIQHYNSSACSSVGGLDISDKGAVCFQTGTNTWHDWTGAAWVARSTGGGEGDSLEWINVKDDYAAVGDGVNDDTNEIDNAVTAMEAATTGAVLFFPPGIYNVSERIAVALANPNNVILGYGAQLDVANPTCDSLVCSDDEETVCAIDTDCGEVDGAILSFTLANNLEIAGLKFFDSDASAHHQLGGEQTHGMVLNGVSNVSIHDVWIEGMGDEAIDVYGASENITVRNSTFKDNCNEDTNCLSQVGFSRSTKVWFTDNVIDGTDAPSYAGGAAISCAGGSCSDTELRDIHFSGNVIENTGATCLAFGPADAHVDGLQVTNNICRNPGTHGLYFGGFAAPALVERVLISGNTIEGGAKTLDEASNGAAIQIIDAVGDGAGVISNNVISNYGNEADTNNHACIRASSGGWAITGNTCIDSPIGITSLATGNPNVITANHVKTISTTGIYVTGDDIVNNNFIDGAASCIYFSAGLAPGQAFANSLSNCTTTGIRLNGTDVWAVNNVISNSAVGITGSGNSPRAYNNKMSSVDNRTAGSLKSDMEFGPTFDLARDWVNFPDCETASPCPTDCTACPLAGAATQPDVDPITDEGDAETDGGVLYRTVNTGATIYDDFVGSTNGQFIVIHFQDNNTTVDFTDSNLKGNAGVDWQPVVDESMTCIAGNTNWYCTTSDTGGGSGDVTAGAVIGDELLVRGDGAVKGVQNSNVTLDDSDNLAGVTSIDITGSASSAGYVRFKEDTDFGTDYMEFKACAADIAANFSHVFPCADGAGVLTSDGVGGLTWSAAGAGDILSVGSACASGACDSISIADAQKIDFSAVALSAVDEGLILPQHATDCETAATWVTEGQVCWEADDDKLWIGDGVGVKEFGGGGGSGDVTDVLGCDGPVCDEITSVSGDMLDMSISLGGTATGTATDGFVLPNHNSGCSTRVKSGQLCFEDDANNLWVGLGGSVVKAPLLFQIDSAEEIGDILAAGDGGSTGWTNNAGDLLMWSGGPVFTLAIDATDQTVDGQIDYDTTEEVIEVGDDGAGTLKFYPGAHATSVTMGGDVSGSSGSASVDKTKCAGTTDYLDGLGNCDTIDGVEDLETATEDSVLVGAGTGYDSKVLPDCNANESLALQYDTATNAFRCVSKADHSALAWTVESPSSSEDITLRYFINAVTITSVECVSTGTSPDTTITVLHHTDRSTASTRKCVDAQSTTSSTNGDNVTLAADCTVPATSFVWLETSAASGTSVTLNCTAYYTID